MHHRPRGRSSGRARRAAMFATAAVATLLLGPAAASVSTARPAATNASIAEAEQVLLQQLEASGIPGGAVVVVSEGAIEARGAGTADGSRPVTATTPFVIGSATKSFTALAVMQLVDSGDVDLEAPVRDYVPELELAPGQPVDDITVRHVLQHTSGLDDVAGGALLASAGDGTPAQAIAELEDAELASTPGSSWRYANANYVLAGLLVEHVSGMSYTDFVERRIFEPLAMTHSYVSTGDARTDGLTEGHRYWFGVPVATEPTHLEATLAAGYLVSSAEDLGRYLSMYLARGVAADGTRLVSERSLDTMLEPGPEAHLGPWADGERSHYAMGWLRGGPWGDDAVFHPGNTPDSSSMLAFFPDRGVAVATLLNAGNELPVPGNPFIADRVARNVIHAAVGQPVVDLPSLRRFYLVFDLVVFALVSAAGWGLVRAARARSAALTSRRRALGWLAIVARSLAIAGLLVLPMLSYGWSGVWTWAPDLAIVMASLVALLSMTVLLRLGLLVRR